MDSDRSEGRPRPKNVTRFLIRVTGDRRWEWEPSYIAMILIEKTLKTLLDDKRLELDLSHIRTRKQTITGIDLFEAEIEVPMDGAQAYWEGFLPQENPFKRGIPAYVEWGRDYEEAKTWSVRVRE